MHCKRTIATTATAAALTIGGTAVAAAAEHTVAPGDTLSEIAGSYSADWQDVYRTNRDVIGADPDLIHPGQVLTVGANESAPEVASSADAATAPDVSVSLPVDDYRLTARFGQCGEHWAACHTGLDFASPHGSAVYAVASGTITSAGWNGAYGNEVVVDHGDGTQSHYAHLSSIDASGSVSAGERIGSVGSTGNSTGPHLHLEIHVNNVQVSPGGWLADRGVTP